MPATLAVRSAPRAEGGLWLIWMDALLRVPLVFAAFFYPIAAAMIGAVVAAVTFGAVLLCNRLRL